MRKTLTIVAILAVAAVVIAACVLPLFFFYADLQTPTGVYIQQIAPDKYEMAFRYRETVFGNHESPTWPGTRYTQDGASWFYVKGASGTVSAKDIVLTEYRACKDPGYHHKEMAGSITFSSGMVTFDLQMPRYDTPDGRTTNTVQRHEPWQHNGTYGLINTPMPPLAPRPFDDRPSTCD